MNANEGRQRTKRQEIEPGMMGGPGKPEFRLGDDRRNHQLDVVRPRYGYTESRSHR
jgi:hypothetical protein